MPPKCGGDVGVGLDLLALAAVVVGVEHEAPFVVMAQQHDPSGRHSIRRRGAQHHPMRLEKVVGLCTLEPLLELLVGILQHRVFKQHVRGVVLPEGGDQLGNGGRGRRISL